MGIFDFVIVFGSYVRGFILFGFIVTIHNIAGKRIEKIGIVSFVPSLSSFAIYFVISYSLFNVVYIYVIFSL